MSVPKAVLEARRHEDVMVVLGWIADAVRAVADAKGVELPDGPVLERRYTPPRWGGPAEDSLDAPPRRRGITLDDLTDGNGAHP